MIDWSRLRSLREEVGPEDFDEVVDLFIMEVDEVVEKLARNALPENLGEDLHFLKGSALSLGFVEFSEHCQTGEIMANDGKADQVELHAILSVYAQSREEFLTNLQQKLAA